RGRPSDAREPPPLRRSRAGCRHRRRARHRLPHSPGEFPMTVAPADLRVLLVFPPQGHPTQPYLALPSLKAWLAQHGFTGATVWDLNLAAYDTLVSDARLSL